MREVIKMLKKLLINILTSGRYSHNKEIHSSDYFIRYTLMNFILLISLLVFVYYGFDSINERIFWQTGLYAVMSTIAVISIVLARKNIPHEISYAVQIMINYLVVLLITLIIEYTKILKDKIISRQKQELEKLRETVRGC